MTVRGDGTFVLVAGAWHGAWCWERVRPLLEQRGFTVITPELAGTGGSAGDAVPVSLEAWARSIADLCSAQPRPVTLLGHSRGGAVISRAAELAPEAIRRLVYLCAYLLPPGGSVAEAARADPSSLVPDHMLAERGGHTCVLRPDIVREAFYGDCDDETAAWAMQRLGPEPLKPLVTPLKISATRHGRVPRAYIECLRDRTIGIDAQRSMHARLACDPVYTLDSGHSPHLSRPAELVELLCRL